MLVRDVMTTPPVTVPPDLPIKAVARMLDQHSVTALPVVDPHLRIVGIVSEADVVLEGVPHDSRVHLIGRPPAGGPYFTRAADVMNFHPVTIAPTADLADATELMTSTSVKSLPVVEDGVVVGVVSRRDVVRVLARADDAIAGEVDDLLRGLDEDWLVEVDDGVVHALGPQDDSARDVVRALATTVPGVVAVRFQ